MNQNIMKPEFAPLYENTPAFSMKIRERRFDEHFLLAQCHRKVSLRLTCIILK